MILHIFFLILGIPEIDLVPMDPLFIQKLDFSSGLGLEFLLTNITITGLKNYIIKDVRFVVTYYNNKCCSDDGDGARWNILK